MLKVFFSQLGIREVKVQIVEIIIDRGQGGLGRLSWPFFRQGYFSHISMFENFQELLVATAFGDLLVAFL